MSLRHSTLALLTALLYIALSSPLMRTATTDDKSFPYYVNAAHKAGLTGSIPNGGDKTKTYILETTGSGIAAFDYNNDNLTDILIVSGRGSTPRLYENQGNLTFHDTSNKLPANSEGWGQGICVADINGDNFQDVLITYWGRLLLLRNNAGRSFTDITADSGLVQDRVRYNTGCVFFDYDRDGDLDLFVSNYLAFDPETAPLPGSNPFCFYRGLPVNCGPRGLPFDRNILYRNDNGRFVDVSDPSGVATPFGHYSLGAVAADFNNDGWPDLYVACDRTPSLLYMNQRDGTFREEALLRGVALDENGQALSGMGVAVADFDHNGWLDIIRTNFSDERVTLYRNRGDADFDEITNHAGLGHNVRYVGWGVLFFDFDNDTWPDILQVNGHVYPEVDSLNADVTYRQRAVLYRNLANGKFEDLSTSAGPAILEKHSARGTAFADFNNDGSLEIIINNQNEPPSLFINQSLPAGNWVLLKLQGKPLNTSAIGARICLTASGITQIDEVRSGESYLSQNDLRRHFGLGQAKKIDRLLIHWPSGHATELHDLPVNQILVIDEETGLAQLASSTRTSRSSQLK